MSITDEVEKTCSKFIADDSYKEFEAALDEYYRLVEEGTISPRKNPLLNNYTTFVSADKLKCSNLKI